MSPSSHARAIRDQADCHSASACAVLIDLPPSTASSDGRAYRSASA